MLKSILSVSGKPGLYKLISNGKNMVIVESLVDKRKLPIHAREKVVSLGDISVYTDQEEVPLREIFISMKKKENDAKVTLAAGVKPEELKKYLEEVLPNFDKERVYPTDIKKMISWYNILIDAGLSFEEEEEKETEEDTTKPKKEDKTEKAPAKKTTAKKAAAPKKETSKKVATPKATRATTRKAQ